MINRMTIVNVPFLDGDYGVYISSHVNAFKNRNIFLTAKFLNQGYRYHKLRKAFSRFYRRHFELIEKYHINQKKLLHKVFLIPNSIEL